MNIKSNNKIFVSFSTKDLAICQNIVENLQSNSFNFWHQKEIKIGEKYKDIIKENINSSVASILLLSNNFLNSNFIQDKELPWIIEKDEKSLIYDIIPIQIEKCDWESIPHISNMQIYPSRTKPIEINNSEHFKNISKHIFNYLNNAGLIEKKGWFR
tara:strand:- start:196 stop:666 length:471 start_codon:yes stop_codon:yes gene_type:complete